MTSRPLDMGLVRERVKKAGRRAWATQALAPFGKTDIKGALAKMVDETKSTAKQKNKFDLSRQASLKADTGSDAAKGKSRSERKKRSRRLRMLRDIPTFRKFTAKQLDLILDHAKPIKVKPGEAIINQGELGDEFYLIEDGEAIVSRKMDIQNPDEEPKELVRLQAPVTVGERAIETSETRNATVTAGSSGLFVLKVMKEEYNKIRELNRDLVTERALDIIRSIEPFNTLGETALNSIARDMQIHHYPKNTYICEQGQLGHTFYIILSGRCRVTANMHNADTGEDYEKEINTMGADQFFGEVALMDKNQRRTANVISQGDVSVLALRRSRFEELMRIGGLSIKEQLLKEVAIRNFTVHDSSHTEGNWFSVAAEWKNAQKRHIRTGRFPSKFEVVARKMAISYKYSLYMLCWQEMSKLLKRGEAVRLKHFGNTCAIVASIKTEGTACFRLRHMLRTALSESRATRTQDQIGLIHATTFQILKAEKDGICKSWANHQYSDLCGSMVGQYYKAEAQIMESGKPIKELFLVVRGAVLIYDGGQLNGEHTTQDEDAQKSRGSFQTIMRPGDIFGGNDLSVKGLMAPNALRKIRSHSAYALTDVDLIAFDVRTFTSLRLSAKADIGYDEKMKVISNFPLFRDLDVQKLATVGVIIKTEEVNRGSAIVEPGKTSDRLFFVLSGFVDIGVERGGLNGIQTGAGGAETETGKPHWMHVTTLGTGEYFGESGVMAFLNKREYAESTFAVAKCNVKLLTLRKEHYNVLSMRILRAISTNFQLRASWRGARLLEAQKAKSEMEVAMADASAHPVLPPHLEGSESSNILSHHYMKAIAESGVRPRHLRSLSTDGESSESGYDRNMINVFELREMGLDKILDPSGNDLNKLRLDRLSKSRSATYKAGMGRLPRMTKISISEPFGTNRPGHWFQDQREVVGPTKMEQLHQMRAQTALLRRRPRSVSLASSVTSA